MQSILQTSRRCLSAQLLTTPQSLDEPLRRSLSSTSRRHRNGKHDSAISLLQKLFPSSLMTEEHTANRPVRHIPRLAIDPTMSETLNRNAASAQASARRDAKRQAQASPQGATLLHIRSAFKNLTPDDFERIIPKAQHLNGWTSENARPLRVIAARDPTLLRTGEYYLLFEDGESATAYVRHVTNLQKKAASNIPVPLAPAVPEPPVLLDDGTVFDEGSRFALFPSGQKFSYYLLPKPFSPVVRYVVENGGYERIVAHANSAYEVLVHFDGGTAPTAFAFRRAIQQDGRDRKLMWRTVGELDGCRELRIYHLDAKAERRPEDAKVEKLGRRHLKRLIVSFEDEGEARRFVAEWHRRDVQELLEGDDVDSCIVNCEYIW